MFWYQGWEEREILAVLTSLVLCTGVGGDGRLLSLNLLTGDVPLLVEI